MGLTTNLAKEITEINLNTSYQNMVFSTSKSMTLMKCFKSCVLYNINCKWQKLSKNYTATVYTYIYAYIYIYIYIVYVCILTTVVIALR